MQFTLSEPIRGRQKAAARKSSKKATSASQPAEEFCREEVVVIDEVDEETGYMSASEDLSSMLSRRPESIVAWPRSSLQKYSPLGGSNYFAREPSASLISNSLNSGGVPRPSARSRSNSRVQFCERLDDKRDTPSLAVHEARQEASDKDLEANGVADLIEKTESNSFPPGCPWMAKPCLNNELVTFMTYDSPDEVRSRSSRHSIESLEVLPPARGKGISSAQKLLVTGAVRSDVISSNGVQSTPLGLLVLPPRKSHHRWRRV